MAKQIEKTITRDLSWLSFNERVLQEAKDTDVHLQERLRFLGIFSNNLDEFFRVRVATLYRMKIFGKAAKVYLEDNPQKILDEILTTVMEQQKDFDRTYQQILKDMTKEGVFIKNEKQLDVAQRAFVTRYFSDKVRTHLVPLMIESIPQMPLLKDKSIYLACVLGSSQNPMMQRYSLIEIANVLPRFIILPTDGTEKHIILLEDIIRFCLPNLFAQFGFDKFLGYIIKVTRDAELEIDNDLNTNMISELEKSLKNRKKGKAVRFVYDRTIDPGLLEYLTRRLNLSKKDHLLPGGRIHNFKDFMDFPEEVFPDKSRRPSPVIHPLLVQPKRILEVLDARDVMLHLPYHAFDSIVDMLREAAIDPNVTQIKITCYRLAKKSKVVNALINAVRNGKQVTVVLELKARFDEEANLKWKMQLEEEGVKVLVGVPNTKVHAKLCLIKKREFSRIKQYAFISTGNLNENTGTYYGDHYLLTTNKRLIADVNRIFTYLENPVKYLNHLKLCKTLAVAPVGMRAHFIELIENEIKLARKKKKAEITIKLNSLVDELLITKLYEAAKVGVKINLIIRGICCAYTENKKWKSNMKALSIIDEYLEHARVFIFHNGGKEKFYISSADWMVRNLDHRVEVACPITDPVIQKELKEILNIQLSENVKGRILDNNQRNRYVEVKPGEAEIRSQVAIFDYLTQQTY